MSALTDRITRMVADAMAGDDVHDELVAINRIVSGLEYRAVMPRTPDMQREYEDANNGR